MIVLALEDKEQTLLDSAGLAIVMAEQRLRELARQADEAQQVVAVTMARLQGTLRTVLALRDLNPDAYAAEWNAEQERIVVTAVAEGP
jgi:hypothetical protein